MLRDDMVAFEAFLCPHIAGTDRRHVAGHRPGAFASFRVDPPLDVTATSLPRFAVAHLRHPLILS